MEENIENRKKGKVYFLGKDMTYLPSIAKSCGYDILENINTLPQKILNEILEFAPDFLVANITFEKFKPQMMFLSKIKELSPHTVIIVSGAPFLTYCNNVTYENPFISYAIFGEAEYTLRDILNGVPDIEITGICYTDDNFQSVKNDTRPFIENLDNLPFPIRKFGQKSAIIEVSRGCPYHCSFCLATPLGGGKVRYRSCASIIEELRECYQEYNIRNFVFKADNFNESKLFVEELCNMIIESGLKIKWEADIMPKNIDPNLAHLMKKSGCISCNLGIESGSKDILKGIEKQVTLEDIKNTVKALKQNHIKIQGCYLFGLPAETEQTATETIKFASELKTDSAEFNIAIPYPGTNFFVYAMLNKLMPREIALSETGSNPVARTHKLSKEQIKHFQKLAIEKYNFGPDLMIKNIIKKVVSIFKYKKEKKNPDI